MAASTRCPKCYSVGLVNSDDSGGRSLCPTCRERVTAPVGADDRSTSRSRPHHRHADADPTPKSSAAKRGSPPAVVRRRPYGSRLLLGAAVALLLVGVGLAVQQARTGGKAVPGPVETPSNGTASNDEGDPIAVAQAVMKLLSLTQLHHEAEEVPAPTPEPDWEQLEVMPALAVEATAVRPQEAPKPVVRQPGKMKRRRIVSEDDLRDQLAQTPEAGLSRADRKQLAAAYEATEKLGVFETQPGVLLQVRPELARLGLRPSSAMQLDPAAAATLGTLSRKLHAYVDGATPKDAEGQRMNPVLLRQLLREEKHGKRLEWLRPEAVPVLRQLLGHEQTPIRSLLVELLAEIAGQRSSELLAERAVFELAPDVRAAAVEALRARPREQFRLVLLTALRYPWAPAANHAAETLAALDDRDALPHLVTLLNQPDPSAPVAGSRGSQFQREVVRVNHTANCLMCHAPAQTLREPVIGVVPGVQRRPGGAYGPRESFWVRADVTFFRQDFSESIPIGPPRKGQPVIRFDYLVRGRLLSPKEAKRLQEQYAGETTYEQREAVLFALRELAGKDPGSGYEEWLALYPTAEMDTEASRLADKLIKASPGQREQVLTQLRDGKTVASTQALAIAIPKLPAAERPKAREALVKRLGALTSDTLRGRLRDTDAEIRRAAAVACAQRKDMTFVADLIPLLHDSQSAVAAEAQAGLKGLTGQDLGDTVTAWQEWMKNEGLK